MTDVEPKMVSWKVDLRSDRLWVWSSGRIRSGRPQIAASRHRTQLRH